MTRTLRLTPEQFGRLAGRLVTGATPPVGTHARARARAGRGGHSALVAAVVERLNVMREVAWCHKFNTGHLRSPDGKRVIRFAFVGCADILGQMASGEFLAIECKVGKDKPTDDQRAFLERVDRSGGCAGCVYTTDQAVRQVELWCLARMRRARV